MNLVLTARTVSRSSSSALESGWSIGWGIVPLFVVLLLVLLLPSLACGVLWIHGTRNWTVEFRSLVRFMAEVSASLVFIH